MDRVVHFGAIALLPGLVVWFWQSVNARRLPKADSSGGSRISPGKISAAVVVVFAAVLALSGLIVAVYGNLAAGALMFVIGLLWGGFMAPSLTRMHDVIWNDTGIDGPSSTFGLTLGLARTHVAWGDLVRSGKTASSYWYVETKDGHRIYWSFLYPGYGAFVADLRRRRSDLIMPSDL